MTKGRRDDSDTLAYRPETRDHAIVESGTRNEGRETGRGGERRRVFYVGFKIITV